MFYEQKKETLKKMKSIKIKITLLIHINCRIKHNN
jgi:hypothetical protein